jgi:Domain of Unknown Function with PDB structure (DUF3857)
MRTLALITALAFAAGAAQAQAPDIPDIPTSPPPAAPQLSISTPTLKYGPPPAWVKPSEVPQAPPPPEGGSVQILLQDRQVRFSTDGDEFYIHAATKVLGQAGLTSLGTFQVNWDPGTSAITLHRVRILRDGQAIDILNGGSDLTVLRRETKLERATLDGQLTATESVPGLQVGDVLEVDYTLRHADPALGGRSQATMTMTNAVTMSTVARWRERLIWPDAKSITWRATDGMPAPAVSHAGGATEVLVDIKDAHLPPLPAAAPARYLYQRRLEATQFATWGDVSGLLAPMFAKAAVLGPQSPLKAEAAKIAAATQNPSERTARALALVQTQVRYQAINLDDGGYVPAPADLTWSRRYGDCKGKTVLLLALLHELGVNADAVLVSAAFGDGLDAQLPQLTDFNHVIVRAQIDGRTYWLDGTKLGDPKALADVAPPPFHWGLPLSTTGASLVKIDLEPARQPLLEVVNHYDASAGIAGVTLGHRDFIMRGPAALILASASNAVTHDAAEALLRSFLQRLEPGIAAKALTWSYDPAGAVFTIRVDDPVRLRWLWNRETEQYVHPLAAGLIVRPLIPPKRDAKMDQAAPYAVNYPFYNDFRTEIVLPHGGAGFQLVGRSFDQVAGATAFTRSAKIEGGVAVFETSARSVAPEFPALDAGAVTALAVSVASNPIELRAPRGLAGPVETEAQPPPESRPLPAPEAPTPSPETATVTVYR